MYEFVLYIILLCSLIYFYNILRFIVGIYVNEKHGSSSIALPVSIIIAVKNGEKNLHRMLIALSKQLYDGEMEFIIVDDNSSDNTRCIIHEHIDLDHRFKYVESDIGDASLSHKKRALDAGINASQYEHLLFTDIDCIIQEKWVSSMMNLFVDDVDYVVGHAYVKHRKSILNKFQRVDLLMLLFAARSMIALGSPWASIGQNQAYTRTLYNRLGGFGLLANYLQGDDTLFLQLAVQNDANIVFNNQIDSYVISRAELSWKTLILQRGRWSGDANVMWKFNLSFYIMALALWLMSGGILFLSAIYCINLLLIILLLKLILEGFLHLAGSKSFNHQIYYLDFLIWFIIHPLYVFIMGIFSFVNFQWKGSSIK